jgi:hypothetical protein
VEEIRGAGPDDLDGIFDLERRRFLHGRDILRWRTL